MAGKRLGLIAFKVDDDERSALRAAAAAANKTVSDYIRGIAMRAPGKAPRVNQTATEPGRSHIDELGADPLRGRDKALAT